MTSLLLFLRLVCLLVAGRVVAVPAPGRVPKVYNALITSNQNLEPSKAYPVYQPVLHDAAFAFPYQPIFYGGDFPINNGLLPAPGLLPKDPNVKQSRPEPPEETPSETKTPSTNPPPPREPTPEPENGKGTPAPPSPPNTQPPIPLNEFGLPAQVLPLGRIDPAFDGFTQVGPFSYSYPGLRFYDPYDPFSLSPYANFPPLYRSLPNVLSPSAPLPALNGKDAGPSPGTVPAAPASPEQTSSVQSPPPEPNDLNVLNYSSKDPAIPNVPPPPLPQGGIKPDSSE